MIVASVVLLPNRIESFERVMDEVEKSTEVSVVYVHICTYYHRLNIAFPTLELVRLYQYFHDFQKPYQIKIHTKDIGPCLKIYGLNGEDVIKTGSHILTLDDDTIIPARIIDELCLSRRHFPDKILGCMGVNAPHFIHSQYIDKNEEVRVLGGYRGILYPLERIRPLLPPLQAFVDELVMEYALKLSSIPLHDDHIFASFFRKHGIHLIVIPLCFMQDSKTFEIVPNTNGIFMSEGNDKQLCLLESFLSARGYEYN